MFFLIDGEKVLSSVYQKSQWGVEPSGTVVEQDKGNLQYYSYPDKLKVVDGVILDKTESELVENARNDVLNSISKTIESYIFNARGYDQGTQLSFNKYLVIGTESQKALLQEYNTWLDSVLLDYYTRRANVKTASTFEELNSISFDFSNNDASDPCLTLSKLMAG